MLRQREKFHPAVQQGGKYKIRYLLFFVCLLDRGHSTVGWAVCFIVEKFREMLISPLKNAYVFSWLLEGHVFLRDLEELDSGICGITGTKPA